MFELALRLSTGLLYFGFVLACSWLALVSSVGGCVLAEIKIGDLSGIYIGS